MEIVQIITDKSFKQRKFRDGFISVLMSWVSVDTSIREIVVLALLIQPLAIQPFYLIPPFPLDIHTPLTSYVKSNPKLDTPRIRQKIFLYFLVGLTGANCTVTKIYANRVVAFSTELKQTWLISLSAPTYSKINAKEPW